MRSRALGHNERVRDQFASTARDGSAPTEGGSRFGADPSSVGYVRTEDEGIEKTPDRQVQEPSLASFASFVSWAVCVKFCPGIVTRNC